MPGSPGWMRAEEKVKWRAIVDEYDRYEAFDKEEAAERATFNRTTPFMMNEFDIKRFDAMDKVRFEAFLLKDASAPLSEKGARAAQKAENARKHLEIMKGLNREYEKVYRRQAEATSLAAFVHAKGHILSEDLRTQITAMSKQKARAAAQAKVRAESARAENDKKDEVAPPEPHSSSSSSNSSLFM